MTTTVGFEEIEVRPGLIDALAVETRHRLETWLGLRSTALRTRRVIHLELGLSDDEAGRSWRCARSSTPPP